MPVFTYKALDHARQTVEGTVTADTPASGRQLLRQQGLRLMQFETVRFKVRFSFSWRQSKSRRREDVGEFARYLSLLLGSGVTLVDALDVLIRQQEGKFLVVLRDIREKVAGGSALSGALEAHPRWFDNIFCSAVRVGQMSGQMDLSLRELAGFIRERQTIKSRIFAALAYPIVLAVLGCGVVLFLMSFVVPQLLSVLEEAGRRLPASTVFLKGASDLLTGHWFKLAVGLTLLVVLASAFYRWERGRRWCHLNQLRIPLLAPLLRKTMIAQFAQMMSLLLRSGVPYLESLQLVRGNVKHMVLAEELQAMSEAIQRGSDIAPTMERSAIFPPLVMHMVHVGQKSGELTEMLDQLRAAYETEVGLAIAKFTSTLEPILIVVMSVVVGFVVYATMMPILEATRVIR